jgi:hypothetical protein
MGRGTEQGGDRNAHPRRIQGDLLTRVRDRSLEHTLFASLVMHDSTPSGVDDEIVLNARNGKVLNKFRATVVAFTGG